MSGKKKSVNKPVNRYKVMYRSIYMPDVWKMEYVRAYDDQQALLFVAQKELYVEATAYLIEKNV